MEAMILAAASLTAWALASRYLFRYWVRNDTHYRNEKYCSHGYNLIHLNDSCRARLPASHGEVALLAILAALFLPVTLFIVFVMARPPLGRRELEEKTRALEAENNRLRRLQGDA